MVQCFKHKKSSDILSSVDNFCYYYKLINRYISEGKIESSLDRGTFSHPSQILDEDLMEFLGVKRNSSSFAYGPESGNCLLKEKICEVENLKWRTSYDVDNVLIVAGAWNGVNLVMEELSNLTKGNTEKTKVIVIGPNHYQMFHRPINMLGINVQSFDYIVDPLRSMPNSDNDIDLIIKESPDIIFISNPNNPNAEYLSSAFLKKLIKECEKKGIYVVIDEIQDFLKAKDAQGLNYGSWINSRNVIRIDSFSKKRALAEYRMGWVIAPSELLGGRTYGISGRLSGLMGNAPRAANTLSIKLLELEKKKIETGEDYFRDKWNQLLEKEQYILGELQDIPNIEILSREACINITIKVKTKYKDIDLVSDLVKKGTLIMPCSGYGYHPEDGILRITFAERWEKIMHSIKVLKETLKYQYVE
jgi:aspartate/methionine/tyrosine aminotransferase